MAESQNAAIITLENRINDLVSGPCSISKLKEDVVDAERILKRRRRELKHRKKCLIEYKEALALLEAGED